jgi:nicotinate-nucleotide adenylyltransferase
LHKHGKRLGLLGGTFDPVHYGHLRSAVELVERYALETMYLVPNHRPAHRGPTGASTAKRIAMLEMAISAADGLAVDAREAAREEPSYTFNTLSELKKEQPDATLVFFMGLDAFALFDTWHRWEDILKIANLVVVNRPDAAHSDFSRTLMRRQQASTGDNIGISTGVIEQCDVTQLAISASDVRRRIANNLSVQFLLPDVVSEYIVREHLYI